MAKESTHKLVNKEGVCVFMGSKRQCKKHKTVELEVQQILSLFNIRLIKSSDYNYLQEIFNKYSIIRQVSKNYFE